MAEAEEAQIVEIAARQEAADAEHRQLVEDILQMKKAALMKQLKQRRLDIKGTQDELSTRLLGAVEKEKDATDAERREAEGMSDNPYRPGPSRGG